METKIMALMSHEGKERPASPARRHFLAIMAAGAGRLSAIAVPTTLLTGKAEALGLFPRDDPRGPDHHCLTRGVRIQTPRGEIAVEDLAVGDLVTTARGPMPVRWIGRKTICKNAMAAWHPSVLPIKISRSAFDDQRPSRDLCLSQSHALLLDGVLIPIKYLVNESSIVVDPHVAATDLIEYFSVKLDVHEVIFVEGVAAETYQHVGGRMMWDNLAEYEALYGREHETMSPFAPRCGYAGGRAELGALIRLAASRFVDMRDPIQVAYSRIAARALRSVA
jgi:hypothetical protein